MIYLESRDTRSDFNLALEQYVFEHMPRDRSYVMLWQNSPAVIVGKYQNTPEELDGEYVRQNGIQVTRRLSGGGAVYHDLGNINYTVVTDGTISDGMDLARFCQPLLRALEQVGVRAELNGRNDVTLDGKKISGSAQYSRGGRVLHHGTILYDSDLTVLEKVLTPSAVKLASKGVASVRSRVTNVRDHMARPLALEEFWEVLRTSVMGGQAAEQGRLTKTDLDAVERLRRERYSTWEWNWGCSPASTLRKERWIEGCGLIQAFLNIEQGRLKDCRFCGDFFGEGATEDLLSALKGCRLERTDLERALKSVDVTNCFYGLSRDELFRLLLQ